MYQLYLPFSLSSVTYPLDLTKTRLQIQGEISHHVRSSRSSSLPHRGMIATAAGIGEIILIIQVLRVSVFFSHIVSGHIH